MECTFESALLPIALVLDVRLKRQLRLVGEVCKTLNTSHVWLQLTALTINRHVEQG